MVEVDDENNPRLIGPIPNFVLEGVVKDDHLENIDHFGNHENKDGDGDLMLKGVI